MCRNATTRLASSTGSWTPLAGAHQGLYHPSPASNGYQSLHTTIFGPKQTLFEIQIRTREMHRTADFGIAAHWRYKEGGKEKDDLDRALHWFRQVLELQLDAETPDQFLEFLKLDLYQDEIFVFTPNGDVHQLPRGATPIDFAFAVHTEVGLHTQGAKVNGRNRPAVARAGRIWKRSRSFARAERRGRAVSTGSRTCARAARAIAFASGCGTRKRARRSGSERRFSSAS